MAPEVIQGRGYDSKADIWSFGMAMIELLTGNPPLSTGSEADAIKQLSTSQNLPKLHGRFSKETIQFVNQCLFIDPKSRPGAFELLKSKFFRGVRTNVSKSPLLGLTKKYSDSQRHELRESPNTLKTGEEFSNPWDFNDSIQ